MLLGCKYISVNLFLVQLVFMKINAGEIAVKITIQVLPIDGRKTCEMK